MTALYEGEDQRKIPNETVLELVNEGIKTVNDLSMFDKTSIEAISHNLRHPAQGKPLVLRDKSQKRLIISCGLVRYYDTVSRVPSAVGMQWIPVMKNFDIQWTSLKSKMD